jgi:hypothetical protein
VIRHRGATRKACLPSGSILPLLAIFMVVIFGILGLVVDMGLLRVTQTQMSAVGDAGALEGLRWRDEFPDFVDDQDAFMVSQGLTPGDPVDEAKGKDLARRQAVNALFEGLYTQGFGIGPKFERTAPTLAGDNPGYAGEMIVPGLPVTYQPSLEANLGNEANGDMLSGVYTASASHADGTQDPGGFIAFERQDFTADPASVQPAGTSFLVRLRRSRDAVEPGVSSTGSAIPLLFARGSAIKGEPTPEGNSARRDGLTVRGTSIATSLPSVYVGEPIGGGVMGVLPVAIGRDAWENEMVLPRMNPSGVVTAVAVEVLGDRLVLASSPGTTVGRLLSAPATTIGQEAVTLADAPVYALTGYVPITESILDAGGTPITRVIGFGRASIELAGTTGVLTKQTGAGGVVAPRNASANLMHAWGVLSVLSSGERAQVRLANSTLSDPVLSPATVRSVGD